MTNALDNTSVDALMEKLQSTFSGVDWEGMREVVVASEGDFMLLLSSLLFALWLFFTTGPLVVLKCFVAALPLSIMISAASFASCWYVDRRRPEPLPPSWIPRRVKNICNSLIMVMLGGFGGVLAPWLLVASAWLGGGHLNLFVLVLASLIPLLHVYAFARIGMRFSRRRGLLTLLLFVLLLAALFCLAWLCCGQVPVIW